MTFWDDQDPDLDDGAFHKVEGETDVTNRSASMIATCSWHKFAQLPTLSGWLVLEAS